MSPMWIFDALIIELLDHKQVLSTIIYVGCLEGLVRNRPSFQIAPNNCNTHWILCSLNVLQTFIARLILFKHYRNVAAGLPERTLLSCSDSLLFAFISCTSAMFEAHCNSGLDVLCCVEGLCINSLFKYTLCWVACLSHWFGVCTAAILPDSSR